jgi:metallo-beta-lactamase family protein
MSDARHVNKHLKPDEKPVEPLYTLQDAERVVELLRGRNYHEWFQVLPGLKAYFTDAGHILGSATITLVEQTPAGATASIRRRPSFPRNCERCCTRPSRAAGRC